MYLSKHAFINLYDSGLENFFDNLNDSSITTGVSRLPNLISFIAKYIIDLSNKFIFYLGYLRT